MVLNKRRTAVTIVIVVVMISYAIYNRWSRVGDDDDKGNSDDDALPSSKSTAPVDWWIPPFYAKSPRLPHQDKRGIYAVVEQLVKPIQCPPNDRRRPPPPRESDRVDTARVTLTSIGDDDPESDLTPESRLGRYLASPAYRAAKLADLKSAIATCDSGVPMMATAEYELLFGLLRKGDAMLEWGSGRSSCIWAHAVGELHSVEDSSGWAGELWSKRLRGNQMVHWMPSAEPAAQPDRPPSSYEGYSDYIRFPLEIASACKGISRFGGRFEVVLVDGRARPQCAHFAHRRLLAEGGLLMIHDWEVPGREYYRIVLRWFELLHVEHSLAVFKARSVENSGSRGGGEEDEASAEGPGFPAWWTRNMDVHRWNSHKAEMVPYKEPFEEVLPPSEQDKRRITPKYVVPR